MVATAKPYAVKNRLLVALPHEEYKRLQPHLEFVQLSKRRTLYEAGDLIQHAYFLNSGMGSLLGLTQGGASVEIAMVGNEGMLCIPAVFRARKAPYRIMVQMPGDALRIKAEVIRAEFKRGGELQDLLLGYTHALITQISQSAVCNRFHTMEKRLCRWLLIPFLHATSDSERQQRLDDLLLLHAMPVARSTLQLRLGLHVNQYGTNPYSQDAEDLCQEALTKIIQRLNDLKDSHAAPIQDFRGYVSRTTSNVCINHLRVQIPIAPAIEG